MEHKESFQKSPRLRIKQAPEFLSQAENATSNSPQSCAGLCVPVPWASGQAKWPTNAVRLIKRDISISWPWPLVTLGIAKRALVLYTACSKHLAQETGKRSAILECRAVTTYHTVRVIRGEQMEMLTFAAMLSQQYKCLPLLTICPSYSFFSPKPPIHVCGSQGVIIKLKIYKPKG